jgi:hypothetical protein
VNATTLAVVDISAAATAMAVFSWVTLEVSKVQRSTLHCPKLSGSLTLIVACGYSVSTVAGTALNCQLALVVHLCCTRSSSKSIRAEARTDDPTANTDT